MTVSEKLELFHNGEDISAYEFFGCHESASGYVFRVWAPHAVKVSVVGDFNGWDEQSDLMEKLADGESFEAHVNAREGDRYKFCITTFDGRKLFKADPYSFRSDFPRSTASVVHKAVKPAKKVAARNRRAARKYLRSQPFVVEAA